MEEGTILFFQAYQNVWLINTLEATTVASASILAGYWDVNIGNTCRMLMWILDLRSCYRFGKPVRTTKSRKTGAIALSYPPFLLIILVQNFMLIRPHSQKCPVQVTRQTHHAYHITVKKVQIWRLGGRHFCYLVCYF